MTANRASLSIAVIFIFYMVGLLGLLSVHREFFLSLTPFNLLLTLLILCINHSDWKRAWWLFPVTALVGLAIEIIGVNTGFPFGTYQYGSVLGFKMAKTPLVIGANWLILIYGAISISSHFSKKNLVVRALLASTLMLLLDLIIEPVAIHYSFWTWESSIVPASNYAAWFAISLFLSAIWSLTKVSLNTKIGAAIFIVQIVFFGVLNLLL
jgi:bisanhydrobacterioruberin hydratase